MEAVLSALLLLAADSVPRTLMRSYIHSASYHESYRPAILLVYVCVPRVSFRFSTFSLESCIQLLSMPGVAGFALLARNSVPRPWYLADTM